MTDNKKQPGPKGFILVDLVDRGNIVEIPLTSNKAWLTLFYALPEELVSKAKAYLDFPRCPYEGLRTDKYDKLINGLLSPSGLALLPVSVLFRRAVPVYAGIFLP